MKDKSYLKKIDFKGIYSNNLMIKLVCLLLAIFLWSFVMGNKNPVTGKDIPEINVEYRGIDKLKENGRVVITPQNPTISMRIEGRRSVITNLKKSDIKAYVDVSSVKSNSESLYINVDLPQGVNLVERSDQNLKIKSESVETVKFPVRLTKVGDLPENIEVASIKLDPEEVKVSGAKTYLNSIDYLSVKIDQSNIEGDVNLELPINLSLKDDSVKNHLTKSSESCKVIIDTLLKKKIAINPITQNVPEGMRIRSVQLNIPEVKVKGEDDLIKSMKSVETKPIDLSGVTDSKTFDIELNLPQGVTVIEDSIKNFTATISLEKAE